VTAPDWHLFLDNLVRLGPDHWLLGLAEKIIRPVIVYLFLVYALRHFGKRILAQLNPFDLVVLLTLSNTVQNAIIGNDTSLLGGIIGALALLGVNGVLVRVFYRGAAMEHRLHPDEDIYLIREHKQVDATLEKLAINPGDLIARAHERGFEEIEDVESAVLYSNGTIYMKADMTDSRCLQEIRQQLLDLRQEVAALALRPQR
jgi:uncharacterized membrane protein YcaP (DUF421 family)